MLKKGHYYKGINLDGTTIIYNVIKKRSNSVKLEVINDNDKNANTHLHRGLIMHISVVETPVSDDNKWYTNPEDITDSAELIAVIL